MGGDEVSDIFPGILASQIFIPIFFIYVFLIFLIAVIAWQVRTDENCNYHVK